MTTKRTDSSGNRVVRRITPQQQLWRLTNNKQHKAFSAVLIRLKKRDQEDICYAMITYIKYGFIRPFMSEFMQSILDLFIRIFNNNSSTLKNDKRA